MGEERRVRSFYHFCGIFGRFVAGECPFCGEVMITSVQLPLISEKEQEEMGEEWNIDWD